MTGEIDPFTRLTPEEQRRRMDEIAHASLPLPQGPISQRRRKAPMNLDERLLSVGAIVTGVVVALGLAAWLLTLRFSASQSPAPTAAQASAAARAPIPKSASPTSSTDLDMRSDGGLDYLGLKAEAEEKLDGVLSDDHGVRYRDVHTKLSTMDGGGIVAFCGEENSRTPEGGYGGFQRFIASRSVAITEDQMTADNFAQAWGRFCDGGVEGPKVWF